ncbi:hypothetical protein [Halomonas dongshanensis]|uniref:hypothetical protein n=1 Tax=Halomonas dongshanensis TaxID=2890835 RepID=UPI003D0014C9
MAKTNLTQSAVDATQPQDKTHRVAGYRGAWLPMQEHIGGPKGVHAPVPYDGTGVAGQGAPASVVKILTGSDLQHILRGPR